MREEGKEEEERGVREGKEESGVREEGKEEEEERGVRERRRE